MAGWLLWVFVGVATSAVVVAAAMYATVLSRGHRLGTRGVVQRSHLRCPKCGAEFDYDWVPGAAIAAVRLGSSRYLACPRCHRWSVFPVYRTMVPRPPVRSKDDAPYPPNFTPGGER